MSMDITGPHPRSREGNEYIMTVVDSFSKFAEAFPIRVHTAQVVARRLVDGVFSQLVKRTCQDTVSPCGNVKD